MTKTRVWNPEILDRIRKEYETKGPTILAKELGLSYWAVVAKARRMGVDPKRKTPNFKWTEEMLQAVKERYVSEGSDNIVREFGIPLDALRKKASSMGLHTIAGHARAGRERAEKSTSCNIRYFDEWSPNMAYILGFLFADGCIHSKLQTVYVLLKRTDECVLDFIKKELAIRSAIRRETHDGYDRSTLLISSTVLIQRLMKLGMYPRKTFRDDPFPEIPTIVLPHFIRGYFDGDGTAHIYREGRSCCVGFVGSPKFIVGIRDSLANSAKMANRLVQTKKGKTADYCSVTWAANRDIRLFREFIYPEGFEFCLKRKKRVIDKWLSTPRVEIAETRRWTTEEEDILRNYYKMLGCATLSKMLNRCKSAVCRKASEFGLTGN